jgi:hypothetical protein
MRTLLSIAFLALLTSFSAFGQNYCEIQSIQYDVINDCGHSVGSEWWLNDDIGGWAAFVDLDDAGFLTYGPFDNSGISGLRQVTYHLLVGDNNSNNLVFTIDVWDATAGEQLSVQDVYQDWFSAGVTPQSFTLSYYHTEGNSMEYRVWFHDSVIGAITGLSVTNDADGDEACDCVGDADGDGTCDEWIYSGCDYNPDGSPNFTTVLLPSSYAGSNYYVSEGSYTWEEANAIAIEAGGHLVTINSAEENAFVQSLSSDSPWIGLYQNSNSSSYSEPDGGWEWVTGECLDYQNWSEGEPNEASELENGEAYAHMTNFGTWNDWENSAAAPFIMEINCLEPIVLCSVPGCTYPQAINYNQYATLDDTSCLFDNCECINEDLIDLEMNCTEIWEPVCGCNGVTYSNDCYANYNGVTEWTAGECLVQVDGCMYEIANNYNPNATTDDGSCMYDDCDPNAGYDAGYDAGAASVECPEDNCPSDLNNDGFVSTADLLIFLGEFGIEC